ncbi:hypothetical protein TNCV_2083181 [Trichonephila clavipes]|nr:hypothetical protein TNCV_2083181 [Trichonephila clavipes]
MVDCVALFASQHLGFPTRLVCEASHGEKMVSWDPLAHASLLPDLAGSRAPNQHVLAPISWLFITVNLSCTFQVVLCAVFASEVSTGTTGCGIGTCSRCASVDWSYRLQSGAKVLLLPS